MVSSTRTDWWVQQNHAYGIQSREVHCSWRHNELDPSSGVPIGNWKVLTTTFRNRLSELYIGSPDPDYKVMAICWADKRPKCIISNWGDTRPCEFDILRERTVVEFTEDGKSIMVNKNKTVIQPNVIRDFYQFFGAIDINDHSRQGTLAIERYWLTKRWWLRIFQ